MFDLSVKNRRALVGVRPNEVDGKAEQPMLRLFAISVDDINVPDSLAFVRCIDAKALTLNVVKQLTLARRQKARFVDKP
jgi:hypothetical protein